MKWKEKPMITTNVLDAFEEAEQQETYKGPTKQGRRQELRNSVPKALRNCPSLSLQLGPSDVFKEESKATNCKRLNAKHAVCFNIFGS